MECKCVKCGKKFITGENGIVQYRRFMFFWRRMVDVCDTCAGVERDLNGYAWEPSETEHTYADDLMPDGTPINPVTVTSDEAFGRKG